MSSTNPWQSRGKEAVVLIVPAAVHGSGEDLVQGEDPLSPGLQQPPLGALAGVDVAVDDVLGVGQDGPGVVGEDHLDLGPALPDEVHVVGHIVHPGEGMHRIAEELPVLFQAQHVLIGVDSLLIQQVLVDEVVAHLVGGVGEHEDDLLRPGGDAPQAHGEAVPAQDGEDDAHGPAAQLGAHVLGDVADLGVVALGPGHDGLGHGHHVPVVELEPRLLGGGQHGLRHDLREIVPRADDGRADAPGNRSDHTAHRKTPHIINFIAFFLSGGAIPRLGAKSRPISRSYYSRDKPHCKIYVHSLYD